MQYGTVTLKPGREIHAKNKHPWVFLGAVQNFPAFANGDILAVESADKQHIGYGYFHAGQSIVGRMFSFTNAEPLTTIEQHILSAIKLRSSAIPADTTTYRLINGEGDSLPGLIVDVYGEVLVLQINTLGIERLKSFVLDILVRELGQKSIYEKASSPTRKKEGLPDVANWLHGEISEPVTVTEHRLSFSVTFSGAQKTGLFLDQREMRAQVQSIAHNRTVLNCFGYTGGFSVYALAGGAVRADTADLDADAVTQARTNVVLNGFDPKKQGFYTVDIFAFLEQKKLPEAYDFIILDPPAFAKRASDVQNASRAYRHLNRLAMNHLPSGGLLLTSSCSQHIDKQLFQTIVFQAAKDSGRTVKIIGFHELAKDHPVSIFFPEGDYLKSLLLYIE